MTAAPWREDLPIVIRRILVAGGVVVLHRNALSLESLNVRLRGGSHRNHLLRRSWNPVLSVGPGCERPPETSAIGMVYESFCRHEV